MSTFGWVCPLCDTVWAPTVQSCYHCSQRAKRSQPAKLNSCLRCGKDHGGLQCPELKVSSTTL